MSVTDRFRIIAGARYSYINLNANVVTFSGLPGELSNSWDALTYSLHGVYDFTEDGSINAFAGISQGFRAPNLSDTTRDDEFGSSGNDAPTADLDPEYYTTYEMGLNVKEDNF
ncbi:MAG: TonB-dependent receptor, partial [Lentisphaeraceae bacterium]|nr:TonB-dependent receptor [Lentisphaeraceae bacterium]